MEFLQIAQSRLGIFEGFRVRFRKIVFGRLFGVGRNAGSRRAMALKLAQSRDSPEHNRQVAMSGLVLVAQKKSPILVQEVVNSKLLPGGRVDVLSLEKKQAA